MEKATNQSPEELDNYQLLVEYAPTAIFTADSESRLTFVNLAVCQLLGYEKDELLGKKIDDFISPSEAAGLIEFRQNLLQNGQARLEAECLRKDGSLVWTVAHVRLLPDGRRLAHVIDISEKKQAERKLNESNERFQRLVEDAPNGIVMVNQRGQIDLVNAQTEKMFGYNRHELIGKSIEVLVPERFRKQHSIFRSEFQKKPEVRMMGGGRDLFGLRKDGSEFPLEIGLNSVKTNAGEIVFATIIDITQRKQSENELYKLAAIVESSDDAIISKDFNGMILSWNKGATRTFGYLAEEVIGKHASVLFPSDLQDQEEIVREKLKAVEYFSNFETVRVKKDGTHFPASITASLIKNVRGETTGISVICRDITVEKQTAQAFIESEEQLRQSQKVEAVGRLAGGIAHDFNNFLAVIMLHIDMLNLQLPVDSSLRYRVSEIKTVTENAAGMVKQLLAFGRKQTLQPHPIVLNQVVKQFMEVLRPLVGEDIDIQLDLDSELGVCFVDPNQVNQVLMNLSVNARDAMPKGGKLKIKSENIQLNKGDIRKRKPQPTGAYIQLTVTDTGTGMDNQTQKRIFEPFFTTKEAGKGTGLGLATVYGIIKQSNGFIWVESEQNHGTTFKIQFPRVDQPSTDVKTESISEFPNGTETILLVEDEEQVRRAAIEVLTVLGYQVYEASNASQAIQLAKLYKDTIHLLLTDVVMPKMNGKEMAEQIKALHPEAAVLYISGYNDDIIADHGILDENLHFLPKPFSPATLAHKVREVLELEDKKE